MKLISDGVPRPERCWKKRKKSTIEEQAEIVYKMREGTIEHTVEGLVDSTAVVSCWMESRDEDDDLMMIPRIVVVEDSMVDWS